MVQEETKCFQRDNNNAPSHSTKKTNEYLNRIGSKDIHLIKMADLFTWP